MSETPEFIKNMMFHPARVSEEYLRMHQHLDSWLNDSDISVTKKNSRRASQFTLSNIANLVLLGMKCATFRDTKEILFYNEESGAWEKGAEIYIAEITRSITPCFTVHNINEIIDKVRTYSYQSRSKFNPSDIRGVMNGVIVLSTREIKKHDPDNWITGVIPIIYDPKKDCPNFKKWLSEVTNEENSRILIESIGYCLYPGYPFHRGFLLLGPTHTGKGTFLRILKAFLGKKNVSNLTLQQITSKDFLLKNLYGKMANLSPDLPSKAVYATGIFKAITGEDDITADIKNKDPIEFMNTAKLFHTANDIPPSEYDDSDAWYVRWIIIDFPNQFLENADKDILTKLTTPDELSGILNLALGGLDSLLERGRFEDTIDLDLKKKAYIMGSNLEKAFVFSCCEVGTGNWISKDDLYVVYQQFANEVRRDPRVKNAFTTQLKRWAKGVKSDRKNIEGQTVYIYKGITLREEFQNAPHDQKLLGLLGLSSFLVPQCTLENSIIDCNKEKLSNLSNLSNSKNKTPQIWKEDVLELLESNDGEKISGREIVDHITKKRKLGVGYNNMLKRVLEELSNEGLIFEPETGKFQKV